MAVQGTWGIGGFRLPDFGVTEAFAPRSNQTFFNPAAVPTAGPRTQGTAQGSILGLNERDIPVSSYAGAQTQVNYGNQLQNSSGSGSGGGGGGAVNSGGFYWSSQDDYNRDAARAAQLGLTPESLRQREQGIRNNINSGFDQYEQGLNSMMEQYPRYEQEALGLLDNTYGSLRSGIDQGLTAANAKISSTREQVANRGKQTISDVATNLRNMLRASNLQLGAAGAGDSSAANIMAPYAYSKIAARETGNVQRQINDQNLDLDQKGIDVQTQYDQSLREVDQWKYGEQQRIKGETQEKLDRIRQMKIGVPLSRVQALNTLEEGLLNQARAELSQLDAEDRNYRRQIDMMMREQAMQAPQYQARLTGAAQYDPREIATNNLPGIGGQLTRNAQESYFNPALALQKRRDQENRFFG